MRLDKYLVSKYSDKTRSYLQKLIIDGFVHINNKICKKAACEINDNDEIKIIFPKAKKLNLKAQNIPLDIIYEDKNILIINKDAGIAVHPSPTTKKDEATLVNAVLFHCKKSLSGISGTMRPGIVHRLDKDTSGVLMIAKNDITHKYLSALIKDRKIKKTYLSLVHGKMKTQSGTIDSPISRNTLDRKKMSISNKLSAKNAITHFKVLKYFEKFDISFLEIQIVTGRTHQIRVHMSAINHPVVFDDIYGDKKLDLNLKARRNLGKENFKFHTRQLLHAWKLSFKLLNEKKERSFEAELKKDFQNIFQKLELFDS
jgi:23S rRNA pseudouridine1911/1915/1917 synthase